MTSAQRQNARLHKIFEEGRKYKVWCVVCEANEPVENSNACKKCLTNIPF